MRRYKIFRADSAKALQKDCSKFAQTRSNPLPPAAADVVYWSECMLEPVTKAEGGHTAVCDGCESTHVDIRVNGSATVTAVEEGACSDPQQPPPIDIVPCAHLWTHTDEGRDMISDLKGVIGCRERCCSIRCRRMSKIVIVLVLISISLDCISGIFILM